MVLVIDNYDSFTYNLVQFIGCLGQHVVVFRNNKITISEIEKLNPDRIVISPGPGWPVEAGVTISVIQHFYQRVPILGVCLGHQSIAHAFDAEVVLAPTMMHGKSSEIFHVENSIFKNVPNPFVAGRYHSLIIRNDSLPSAFKITAQTADEMIMGIQHCEFPTVGVQFHPESILTEHGMLILENFLSL
ncbi:aminodeoxychorismate/anthranilate synthase component II [candidate division KSB1 bacterium]|nr:aminodeoxychorismate/anthranilate synthase component II [candidate division KSB1 bacterium]